jgi:diacylglycerol kinase (ATP)
MTSEATHLLFVINPGSGKNDTDWSTLINEYFSQKGITYELFGLTNPVDKAHLSEKLRTSQANKIIAVGGDGTIKLLAGHLKGSSIPLGIVPAGSANGLARELGISVDPSSAFETIITGEPKAIHLLNINNELCIHLSDIGFNAFVIKKFEDENTRGMIGYAKAAWKVLWQHAKMEVKLLIDDQIITREAAMVVIANATMYGNGVSINPFGSLYDRLFEVVVIRKVSFTEILKMRFTKKKFNRKKTEMYQVNSVSIKSTNRVHFQVDGEYLGKINSIEASLFPASLQVIVPKEKTTT